MFVKADGQPIDTVKLFDALIDDFPDMIHSVDAGGRIVYVNRMAPQLLGYTADELCAMNIRDLYPPEILEAVEKGFVEVKKTGEKRIESLFMAKDGTRIPVELRTLAIRNDLGAFAQTFTVSRDLRKFKEMQEDLIHASRLAAIGELAAGVAHDLNNPLTAVILASTILKNLTGDAHSSVQELRENTALYSETIAASAGAMEALTTRLRDFARGVKEQHAPVDLFDPISDALFILAHKIRHGNVQVSCPVVKAQHGVLGDRNQLQQIFLNLFSNACDAMAECDVRRLSVAITPDAADGARFWSCAVSDTGRGIPADIQQRLFQAFFTTKPRGKGTGLGLSICRTIAREHGGDLRLSSAPGKGTTFFVRLPISPIQAAPSGK